MAQEKQVVKLFDGRRVKPLPYYCPEHPTIGRHYAACDGDPSASGKNQPKVVEFNMPLCNNARCNRILASFNPSKELLGLEGHHKPRLVPYTQPPR